MYDSIKRILKKPVWMVVAVIMFALAVYGVMGMMDPKESEIAEEVPGIAAYTFACAEEKSIRATFGNGEADTVDLILSDSRTFSLTRAVSASGERFTNADATVSFWTKADTAFLTEGTDADVTYSNCIVIPPRLTNE